MPVLLYFHQLGQHPLRIGRRWLLSNEPITWKLSVDWLQPCVFSPPVFVSFENPDSPGLPGAFHPFGGKQ